MPAVSPLLPPAIRRGRRGVRASRRSPCRASRSPSPMRRRQRPRRTVRPKAAEAKPSAALTADLMYRLLIGDIALQRGEPALAARAYFEAAREAKDPVLARRATEIAVAARQRGLAVEAAKLWSELDPAAERPKQVIAAAGGGGAGKGADSADGELKSQIEKALAAGGRHARRRSPTPSCSSTTCWRRSRTGPPPTSSSPRWPSPIPTFPRRISPWRWPR